MGCGEFCAECPLERSGSGFTQVDIGARYAQTRLLLVGEASGEAESRDSLPFRPYAQSGSLLAKTLNDANVSRSEVAITNVLRCRPPKDWLEGAPYQYAATQHCISNYLIKTIADLQPRAILALGGTAMRALTVTGRGKYQGLDYLRGYVLNGAGAAEGIPVIPAYHPAFIRRGAAHLTSTLKRDIQRAFKVATGQLKEGIHYALDPMTLGLKYQMNVRLEEAWKWVERIDPELPLYWDCETPRTAREDEEDYLSFADRDMKLFQATQRKGEGIALPFREEFIEVAKAILASPTLKVTQNGWNFDEPVAKANGLEVNVEKGSDDVMVMFGRVEADLPANLQAIAQYCGFPFPWKHFGENQPEFYGVADVDALAWSYPVLKGIMEREGTWDAYMRYFRTYHHRILRRMSERGDPISEEKRLELKSLIEREDQEVDEKVRELVPREVLSTKQKAGYKRAPKNTTGLVQIEVTIKKEEKCSCLKKDRPSCPVCLGSGIVPAGTVVTRWAEQMEFNPNSSLQVKRLMKHLGHKVPKHSKRTDAATGEASDTTEVKELERLANKTKHPIYSLLIEKRQLSKLMGTYVEGWRPGRDGRVHSTFGHKATWQPSAKSPNLFNGIKRGRTPSQKARVKAFNAMQRAEPGHLMVNLDLKSFHAQTMACEVGNAEYLRLTKLDQHSFVTCHVTKHPERHNLLKFSNADLKAFFAELKADKTPRYKGPVGLMTFKEVRDGKTKSCIAEGELVLTERGLIPIQNVLLTDRVWDGVEWVNHEGLIDQGIQEIITYQGLTATPNHEVFTFRGSKTLLEAAQNMDRLLQTGDQGQAIRARGRDEFKADSRGRLCEGSDSMRDLQPQGNRRLSFSEIGTWNGMQLLCQSREDQEPTSGSAGSEIRRDNFAVFESSESGLSALRRTWDQVSLRFPQWVRAICGEDAASRFVPWGRDRQNQQRWELRAGKSEIGDKCTESSEPTLYYVGADFAREGSVDGMGFTIRQAVDGQVIASGLIGRADYRAVTTDGHSETLQELATTQVVARRARVYDLLNAGPRHRFTVSNVLVHNCGLGIGFGMQGRKLYQMYQEDFENEAEAKAISNLIRLELFDGAIGKWQEKIKRQAAEDGYLRSRFGAIRRFYDVERWNHASQRMMGGDQAEAAIAFLPASNAFGMMRDIQLRLDELGYLERFEMVNSVYDSIQLHPLKEEAEEAIRLVQPVMEAPSEKMVYAIVPEGLSVEAEASIGESMAKMVNV